MPDSKKCIFRVLLFALIFSSGFAFGQDKVVILKSDKSIIFDGMPFEEIWEDIDPFPMVTIQPNFGAQPSEKTEIRIFYNEDFIYVSGRLYDKEPSKILSATKKRDELGPNSDLFGIVLDTFNDNENALSFSTTPIGLRSDMTIFNDANANNQSMPINQSWNAFWDVKTVVNEEGWFAEMRIPVSSLRFQDEDGKVTMGIIVWRWLPHKNESMVFPPIHPKHGDWAMMKPSKAQDVEFHDLKSKKPLYIAPYLLTGFTESNILNEEETEYLYEKKLPFEGGLDVKYGLSSNLTLDVTVNTDFAQVEADDQMVNLSRFSLFFPEKRLFFQERSSIFNFSIGGSNNLFYSRRIGIYEGELVRIYGGVRLTGKVGAWDLGFLDMQTASFEDQPTENFGVLRMRRQIINENSYIGAMITSRVGWDGSYNYAYGIDGIFKLFGEDYLDVKLAQTFENDFENDPFSLDPSRFRLNWQRRSQQGFGYDLSYSRSGKNFNPGIGFEIRDDYECLMGQLQYGWLPGENSKLFSHKFFIQAMQFNSVIDGSLESLSTGPGWNFQTKNVLTGNFSFNYMIEDVREEFSFSDDAEIPVGRYEFFGFNGMLMSPMTKKFYTTINIEGGQFYDGSRLSVSITPVWNVSSSFELSGMYQYNKLDFTDRNQEYTAHIGRFKMVYMLNTKLSASAFIQYNSGIDAVIANFRLRYNPREGNDFYLVYNEGQNSNLYRERPFLPRLESRTIMLKYTYTFNL
ncbi:DUF5916 domain-containing protein [Bacteroidota bacterium]